MVRKILESEGLCEKLVIVSDDIYNFASATGFNCYRKSGEISFFRIYRDSQDRNTALADWPAAPEGKIYLVGDKWFFLTSAILAEEVQGLLQNSYHLPAETKNLFKSKDSDLDWCVRFQSSQILGLLGNVTETEKLEQLEQIEQINRIYPGAQKVIMDVFYKLSSSNNKLSTLDDIGKEAAVSNFINPVKQLCKNQFKE